MNVVGALLASTGSQPNSTMHDKAIPLFMACGLYGLAPGLAPLAPGPECLNFFNKKLWQKTNHRGAKKKKLLRVCEEKTEGGEIMDLSLIKRAVFTEVKQFVQFEGTNKLLKVRLIDELDDKGNMIVYCTEPHGNRVRFCRVLSRKEIDDHVVGGVKGQSRRGLCRLLVAQLNIFKGALVLVTEQDEHNESAPEQHVNQQHGEDDEDDDEDKYIQQVILHSTNLTQ